MPILRTAFAAIVLAGLVGGSVGCSGTTTWSFGAVDSSASWTSDEKDDVPGIDDGAVDLVKIMSGPDEGVSCVVWSDLTGGGTGSSSRPGMDRGARTVWEGHHDAHDGRRVEFKLTTVDGKTARLTIAGVEYDLAQGALVLVSTQGAQPVVKQVQFDLKIFPEVDGEKLREFAERTPQVRGFFEQQQKVEATAPQR